MRANLDATNGVVFAERAVMLLAPRLGRQEAHTLVTAAIEDSRTTRRRFGDVLRAIPEVATTLSAADLDDFDRPEGYLGEAETLRRQLLDEYPPPPTE
jgi:3-carboxy-cis,cis-muconate cycloisomerase